jgi:hypothetical protein
MHGGWQGSPTDVGAFSRRALGRLTAKVTGIRECNRDFSPTIQRECPEADYAGASPRGSGSSVGLSGLVEL